MNKKEITGQNFETPPPETNLKGNMELMLKAFLNKDRKIKFLVLASLVLLALLGLLALSLTKKRVAKPSLKLTPTPTISSPRGSKYASDPGIMEIQKNLEQIETEIKADDLLESSLNPPLVDWNIGL